MKILGGFVMRPISPRVTGFLSVMHGTSSILFSIIDNILIQTQAHPYTRRQQQHQQQNLCVRHLPLTCLFISHPLSENQKQRVGI